MKRIHELRGSAPVARSDLRVLANDSGALSQAQPRVPRPAAPCRAVLRSCEAARTFGVVLSVRLIGRRGLVMRPFGVARCGQGHRDGARGCVIVKRRAARRLFGARQWCHASCDRSQGASSWSRSSPRRSSERNGVVSGQRNGAPGPRRGLTVRRTSLRGQRVVSTSANRSAGPRSTRLLRRRTPRGVDVETARAEGSRGFDVRSRSAEAVFGPTRQSSSAQMSPTRVRRGSPDPVSRPSGRGAGITELWRSLTEA